MKRDGRHVSCAGWPTRSGAEGAESPAQQYILHNDLSKTTQLLCVTGLILGVGLFYLLTLRQGHVWGDDFAMYIHHAKNIAEGRPYADTGYIYDPFCPEIGPRTFPPVFPLLLSLVVKCFGLNLMAMKREIVCVFMAFLFMIFLVFRDRMVFARVLAMIAVLGLHPVFWEFKDQVLSDIPFLFFVYLALWVLLRATERERLQTGTWWSGVLAGFCLYAAYGTRSVGAALPLALIAYDIITLRKYTRFSITALAVFLVGLFLQNTFLHADASYFDDFAIRPGMVLHNALGYVRYFFDLLGNGHSRVFQGLLFFSMALFFLLGYAQRVRQGITILEIFPILYMAAVILLLPGYRMRFLFPVMPLCLYYIFEGLRNRHLFCLIVVSVLVSYAGTYSTLNRGPLREGVEKPESIDLFNHIKNITDVKDVFVFRKPRALALYAHRSASAYHCPKDPKELWDYCLSIHATYLVVGRTFERDRDYLQSFVMKYAPFLQETYANEDFKMYRIRP